MAHTVKAGAGIPVQMGGEGSGPCTVGAGGPVH